MSDDLQRELALVRRELDRLAIRHDEAFRRAVQ